MTCESVRELADLYLYGELAGAEEDGMEQHLHGCAACRAELERQRVLHRSLETLRTVPPPSLLAELLRQASARGKPASAQDLECQRDGSKGADQEQCPADGPALLRRKALPEQKREAGTERRTRAGDQSEFRNRNLCFSHGNTSLFLA